MKIIIITMISLKLIIEGVSIPLEYWEDDLLGLEQAAGRGTDCLTEMCLSSYVEKRNQDMPIFTSRTVPVKCPCQPKYRLRELGVGHYPKTLLTADCPYECSNESFQCKPVNYTVYVLQHRTNYMQSAGEYPLPEPIRSKWQLIPEEVTVTCMSSDIRNKY